MLIYKQRVLCLRGVVSAKRRSSSNESQVASTGLWFVIPVLYLFVIPVLYLNQPSSQEISQAEEEFGFDHPMGGLMIPCTEDAFIVHGSNKPFKKRTTCMIIEKLPHFGFTFL
ncbi:LOW QUALITY PROTEIN: Small auxin-up RNA [Trema orientale]|uniref:Small auxin-up RNA n=1 Tax=Trema orientale TaxID=63057 RepID=A0A2P5F7N9_TREOI|nr:LOW QUALITY PROTEIN: Small auxin-up RNA [Trema orientale]